MQYIDAFNHFFPKRLWDKMLVAEGAARDIGKRMRGIPCIYDLDERFRVMDMFKDKNYTQILSLGMPPLEALGSRRRRRNTPGSAMTAWPSWSTNIPTASPAMSRRCR